MKQLLAALAVLAAPMVTFAGDPCPITFRIHDLGAPDWLDHDALISGFESQAGWLGLGYREAPDGLWLLDVVPGMHRRDKSFATIPGFTAPRTAPGAFRGRPPHPL